MLIVVPDDNPPVLAGTPALERLRTIGEVRLYDSDATDPKILIDRLREADVALNIRGRTLFHGRGPGGLSQTQADLHLGHGHG